MGLSTNILRRVWNISRRSFEPQSPIRRPCRSDRARPRRPWRSRGRMHEHVRWRRAGQSWGQVPGLPVLSALTRVVTTGGATARRRWMATPAWHGAVRPGMRRARQAAGSPHARPPDQQSRARARSVGRVLVVLDAASCWSQVRFSDQEGGPQCQDLPHRDPLLLNSSRP
jgi:hypothetical protein